MRLVMPTIKYKNSYYELIKSAQKNNESNELGNALIRNNESFNEMIKRLKNRRFGKEIHKRDVPACIYWIIENDMVVGTIDMRFKLNQDYFEKFGHVAYYIKKEERNKSYATKALKLVINKYRKMHTKKILVTCLNSNIASQKVITKNKGILEKSEYNKLLNKNILRYIISINN